MTDTVSSTFVQGVAVRFEQCCAGILLWSCWRSFFNTCLWALDSMACMFELDAGFNMVIPVIPLLALLSQAVKGDPKTFRFAAESLKDDKGFPNLGVTDEWKQKCELWLWFWNMHKKATLVFSTIHWHIGSVLSGKKKAKKIKKQVLPPEVVGRDPHYQVAQLSS